MAKSYQLQLVRRDSVAYAGAVIVAWWKKLRSPLENLKDPTKLSLAAIELAPPPRLQAWQRALPPAWRRRLACARASSPTPFKFNANWVFFDFNVARV